MDELAGWWDSCSPHPLTPCGVDPLPTEIFGLSQQLITTSLSHGARDRIMSSLEASFMRGQEFGNRHRERVIPEAYPQPEHAYKMKSSVLAELRDSLGREPS